VVNRHFRQIADFRKKVLTFAFPVDYDIGMDAKREIFKRFDIGQTLVGHSLFTWGIHPAGFGLF
jgi:hypothetical protein